MHDDTYYRDKILELEDRLDSIGDPSEGSVCEVVQTVKVGTYPAEPAAFFAVQPLGVDGLEKEGEAASFTPDADRTFYAANLGSAVPPEGTKVIVTSVSGRWTFRFDGADS